MVTIQAKQPDKETALPLLRQDIKFYRGPDDADGSPTYNLFDPVRAQYFKISWTETILLQNLRPGITLSQLTEQVNQHSTLKVTTEEVQNFFLEASRNNLLASQRASEDVLKESDLRKTNPIVWLAYHYLYIRIPLINPDAFLDRTLKYVQPLASRNALIAYFTLVCLGLLMLAGRFEEFIHTFSYFFNLEGAIIYGLAITCVKVIHEFSHAYVAKYYRLHVPTMGVAMIVLWPVLYTDVTDGWKLSKRSQRLAISFAGIAAESIIAGISTLGWALSEQGLMQSVFFVIASVTWISTLIVNLNPAMRFDGYYLMCDLAGIDNLQSRAFSFTRWQFRKWLLGLDVSSPEELMTPKRKWGFISYSLYTWVYRVFLYTTIAVFVYFQFTKALGFILFLLEIGFFILLPIYWEAKDLKALYPYLKINPRLIATTSVLMMILLWVMIPFPHEVSYPAITIPADNQNIYIPQQGVVKEIYVKMDDPIKKGQPILQILYKPLDLAIIDKQADVEVLEAQIHILSLSETDKVFIPEKQSELAVAKAKLKGLQEQKNQLKIVSKVNGTLYSWDDSLHVGQSVAKDQVIGKVASLNYIDVIAFVPESSINDLKIGQKVVFKLKSSLEKIKGKISDIRLERASLLIYPQLASTNKGDLPVSEESQEKLVLVESYFPIEVKLEETDALRFGQTGQVLVEGPWRSIFMRTLRYTESILWRESGL